MNDKLRIYQPGAILTLVFIITAIRIAALYISTTDLFFDEAQYWTWSKALSFGYFSKPPMVAWLISATTEICSGDSPFCVRLSAPLLHGLTALLVYYTARDLYDRRTGFWSAITYLTLPGVTLSSFFISTDAPLMFFWALAFRCFVKAPESDSDKWWLLTGLAVGLGMLSKYTLAVFFIAAAMYLLLHKPHRKLRPFIHLTIAGMLAALIFFPNLYWNAMHHFVSFQHTNENVLGNMDRFQIRKLLEFLVGQLFVFGPILLIALGTMAASIPRYLKEQQGAMLIPFTFVLLIIAIIISFSSGAQAHWAAPAYIAGSILTVRFLLLSKQTHLLRLSLGIHIAVMCLFLFATSPYLGEITSRSPFARLQTWNMLATPAAQALTEHPGSVLVSDERKAVATLMYRFHTKEGMPYPVMKWNPGGKIHDHYDLMNTINLYRDRDFVFITRAAEITAITPYFVSVEKIREVNAAGKIFTLYSLHGFKGY